MRQRWPYQLAVGLGIAAAVAVAGSVTLVQSASAGLGVDRALAGLGSRGYMVVTQSSVIDEKGYSDFQAQVAQRDREVLASLMIERRRFAVSSELFPLTLNGQALGEDTNRPRLESDDQLEGHVTMVSGRLPATPKDGTAWNVTVSDQTGQKLNLRVGDLYCVTPLNQLQETLCARVSGVWRPRDPADPYWGGLPPQSRVLSVTRAQLYEIVDTRPHVDASSGALFEPDPTAFRQMPLSEVIARFQRFRGYYSIRRLDAAVATDLDSAIEGYAAHARAAAFAIQLLATQILAVTLFYLAFVAGQVLERQRDLLATWKARGWSRRAVWSVLMLEFAGLSVIAVPAGLAIAWFGAAIVARAVFGNEARGGAPPRPADLVLPIGIAVVAGLGVLAAQALRASRWELSEVRPLTSRPPVRGWWQWRYADIVLAALAVPLLLQARTLGRTASLTEGEAGADPLSLLLPGLATVLLALAALRLLPSLARVVGWAARGLGGRLAAWQLARNPGQHAGLALLFAITIALGLFARAYSDTQVHNAADRAAYAVGSDFRLQFDGPYPRIGDATAALEGVTGSSQVFRGSAKPGRSAFAPTVLGVDPAKFDGVAWTRPDLASEPLSAGIRRLAGAGGLQLPGRPEAIGLWVYSPGFPVTVFADVQDARDRRCSCALGSLDYSGWRHLESRLAFAEGGPTFPVRLMELRFDPIPKPAEGMPKTGTVAVSQLTAGPVAVERFGDPSLNAGWWRTGGATGLREPRGIPAPTILREGDLTLSVRLDALQPVFLRPPPSGRPLPALAPSTTLARLGIRVGETFLLSPGVFGAGADFGKAKVVGVADHFPTLYPEKEDFVVVPRDAYLAAAGYAGQPQAWPNEVWIKVAERSAAADRRRLGGGPNTVLRDRRALTAAALRDPLWLELEANLVIGFATSLALALVGFSLHFLVSSRARIVEFALLEANGLSGALIEGSIRAEQWTLLAFSTLAGVAAGAVLALVLLPSIQLSSELSATVPATAVRLDPGPAAATLAVVLVATAALAWVLGRLGARYRLMAVLRTLG